jgi:hypothetical protein
MYLPAANSLGLSTNGTNAVYIDSSQKVGIGTSSPNANLQVSGGIQVTGTPTIGSTGVGVEIGYGLVNASEGAIQAYNRSGSAWINMAYSALVHKFLANNSEAMRIANDGSLLVGTTANIGANAKIYAVGSGKGIAVGTVPGSATFRHLYMNTSDTSLYFFNDANYASLNGSGAWTNASDARLKKNIFDIKYGLADVLKAQPRSYQMHAVVGDFVGFVAQELQEVIPEVVSGDPEKQLGVDYGSLVAVAFKAIKELKLFTTYKVNVSS